MTNNTNNIWPSLVLKEWEDTLATLHLWTQIVGKIRLKLAPPVNHWWHVPLYVSARGLTTSPMTYDDRIFEIQFDFIDHKLLIACSDGTLKILSLRPESVANFYERLMAALFGLGIQVKVWPVPVEIANPIRFDQDEIHKSYDADYANRFWRALVNVDNIFKEFRARFIGKVSPVHFWWGSFDHAVTRFSGRPAPPREDADKITQEAYSHEVISHGFWLGGNGVEAMFYAYAAPEPAGFSESRIEPAAAFYSQDMKEFFLPYDAVRQSASPEHTLMDFLQSTYKAGAKLAKWDRKALER